MRTIGRLIPACAGKTLTICLAPRHLRAHPRVCGENVHSGGRGGRGLGSSPRVRGKPFRLCEQTFYDGLIPACAGKTERLFVSKRGAWAHPRVCGENEP